MNLAARPRVEVSGPVKMSDISPARTKPGAAPQHQQVPQPVRQVAAHAGHQGVGGAQGANRNPVWAGE